MKGIELIQGMEVLISKKPTWTAKTHTVIKEMRSMTSKRYTIEKIVESEFGLAAVINTYWWHPKDLTLVKPEKPKIHLFDVKELVT